MSLFIQFNMKDVQDSVVLEKGRMGANVACRFIQNVKNASFGLIKYCGPNKQLHTVLRRISIRLGEALASTTSLSASLEMTGFSTMLTLMCNCSCVNRALYITTFYFV